MAAVTIYSTFGAQGNIVSPYFHFFSIYLHEVVGLDAMILVLWRLSFKQLFHSLPPSSRGSLVPLCFPLLGWYHLHIWGYWYLSQQSWFQFVLHLVWHFTWCVLYINLISWVTVYSHVVFLSQFWASSSFHMRIPREHFMQRWAQ